MDNWGNQSQGLAVRDVAPGVGFGGLFGGERWSVEGIVWFFSPDCSLLCKKKGGGEEMDLIWGGRRRNKEVCLMAFQNGKRKIMVFNVLEGKQKRASCLSVQTSLIMTGNNFNDREPLQRVVATFWLKPAYLEILWIRDKIQNEFLRMETKVEVAAFRSGPGSRVPRAFHHSLYNRCVLWFILIAW